jgi:hypothetical protein
MRWSRMWMIIITPLICASHRESDGELPEVIVSNVLRSSIKIIVLPCAIFSCEDSGAIIR